MLDWRKKLRQGAVACRVLHDGDLVEEFTPTDVDQLWTSIVIRDLGETTKSYFAFEYEQFVEGGKVSACYECEDARPSKSSGRPFSSKNRLW